MSPLCSACQQLLESPAETAFQYRNHHDNLDSLVASACDGCCICSQLYNNLASELSKSALSVDAVAARGMRVSVRCRAVVSPSSVRTIMLKTDVYIGDVFNKVPGMSFSLRTGQEHLDQIKQIPAMADDADRVAERPAFSMDRAKIWLDHCLRHHDICRSSREKAIDRAPTRLLEIDKPSFNKVRLVSNSSLSSSAPENRQYATLSHCWGMLDTIMLTQATHQLLENGISISELGTTFRDAVEVARSLNIPYIWIDAMCILQDVPGDWIEESPQMGSYYGGGVLNISADTGTNTHAGLWSHGKSGLPVNPTVVTINKEGIFEKGAYVIYNAEFCNKEVDKMPLMSRGWVMQERLLGPRQLHFTERELFWECSELCASDRFPGGLPFGMTMSWLWDKSVRRLLQGTRGDFSKPDYVTDFDIHISTEEDARLQAWAKLVETYSKCELTYKSDKLVAISGIAKFLKATSFHCQYIAGLWRENFLLQLLWRKNEWKTPHPMWPYQAPTWSWASGHGEISYALIYGHYNHHVIASFCGYCIKTPSDSMAEVTGGSIRLAGYLFTIKVQRKTKDEDEFFVVFDKATRVRVSERSVSIEHRLPRKNQRLHALPISVSNTRTTPEYDTRFCLSGLLLESVGTKRGVFIKAGIFEMTFPDDRLTKNYRFLGKVKNKPWMEYESRDENGLATVIVV